MSDEENPWGDAVDQNAMELASGDASDVTLRAGAEGAETTDVRFSRILLACHSPVFRTMLFGSMSESRDDAPVRVAYSLEVVQRLLAYCATADDACDPETAIELHNAADFYQIGGLAKHVAEFIVSSLDANTATTLFDSAMAHEQEELAATCLEYVEKHATRALSGELVCRLSQDAFLVLVQSEALRMSEIELFEAVVRWGEALVGRAIRTDEIELSDGKKLKARVAPLIEHVRFGLMSGEDLAANVMPTELVDIAVTHDAFAAQFLKVKPAGVRHSPRTGGFEQIELLFPEQASEDAYRTSAATERSGLFWHLYQISGARGRYARPTSVTASWSTLERGPAEGIVGLLDAPGQTGPYSTNVAGSWCEVDLGEHQRMLPNRYAVRHGSGGGHLLQHWRLEGRSESTKEWTVLRTHANEPAPRRAAVAGCWPVDAQEGLGFRYLRILSTGPNLSSHNYLFCSGLEFWGTLTDDTPT